MNFALGINYAAKAAAKPGEGKGAGYDPNECPNQECAQVHLAETRNCIDCEEWKCRNEAQEQQIV